MLKMLTTHALTCDGDGCNAYHVPSGHYDVTDRGDAVILSDAVHATRGAAEAGWAVHTEDGPQKRLHLCPPCAKTRAARQEAAHRDGEQMTLTTPDGA